MRENCVLKTINNQKSARQQQRDFHGSLNPLKRKSPTVEIEVRYFKSAQSDGEV